MELTESQYARIAPLLPKHRGNVNLPNLQVLNAIPYVTEHGCKWRGLPERFGNWHTICTRMNRWSKSGVLDRVFERLQREQIIRLRIEALSLDSTGIKVHSDGTGARKQAVDKVLRRLKGFRWLFSRFDRLNVMFPGFIVFVLIVEAPR